MRRFKLIMFVLFMVFLCSRIVTAQTPDTEPPTITSVNPSTGTMDVAVTSTITVTFSEAMDDTIINVTTFLVSDGSSNIAGTISYSGTTATFTPSGNLAYSTIYAATITTGVKDVAGNAMAADYTWSFTTGAAPNTPPVANAGPVSWWSGEGNANDVVDGNHGTLVDGATFGPGKIGQAFSFDGIDDRVEVPDSLSLRMTGPLTLTAWLRLDAYVPMRSGNEAAAPPIAAKWAGAVPGYGLFLLSPNYTISTTKGVRYSAGGEIFFSLVPSDGVATSNPIPLNEWHHFAGVYDSNALRLYVDGVLVDEEPLVGYIPEGASSPLVMGGYSSGGDPLPGSVDEVKLYARALSASEIQDIFTSGGGGGGNQSPIANAGPDQSVYVGNTVTLDGSGSTDVDGDLLTRAWAFTTKPQDSNAVLSDTAAVNPTFTVDKSGTYVVSLIVNDGTVNSAPDTVTISTLNSAPVASAGADQSVYVGNTVTLDGSGSTDVDGNLLTYSWAFTSKPSGSTATLNNQTSVNPTFTVDVAGTYVASLIVNDGTVNSTPDTVTVSTLNSAPVASAGADQSIILIGSTIQLDGSQSYDPDGDAITYQWSFTSVPAGSSAILEKADTATPTFVADVRGEYVAQLLVSDASTQSTIDTVTISFENVKPIANPGTSQSVTVGTTVPLDGSGSADANGDTLTYQWTLSSVPTGSSASIADPDAKITSFVPDVAGTYVVQLVVNDGYIDSNPSTIQVQAVISPTTPITIIQNLQSLIMSLNPNVFKNANMQNTLINKLNAVMANIESGNYADALDQLQNDILKKTDGCATNRTPDKNDWITDCNAQEVVYPSVIEAITAIGALL